MISIPGYFNDPYVAKTQKDLYGFGTDLLAGNPNSYFKPIGEFGGQELEDVIGMGTRDITQSAAEDAARRGSRGGGSAVARAVADYTKGLRYADFQRALEGRKFFMNTGLETIGGVRNAGITSEANRNAFNLDSTRLEIQQDQFEQEQAAKKKAARDAMYAKILSSSIGIGLAPFTGGASLGLAGMNFSNPFSAAGSTQGAGAGTASVRPDMFAEGFFK